MDERILRFRVGVVVVAALLVLVSLVVMFGKGFQNNYTLFLRFKEAPGVTTNTPVRKSGILIGRVSNVELVDEGVLMTVKIFNQYKIRQNQVPRIGSASLLGDAVIDFVPRAGDAATEEYPVNALIADGVVTQNPLEALDAITGLQDDVVSAIDSIKGAGQSIETAGANVSTLANNVNNIVGNNEGQMRRILQKTELTLDNLNSTTQRVGGFLEGFDDDELKMQLKDTLANLRDASAQAKTTLVTAEKSLASFEEVGATVQETFASMDRNISELTDPFRERGPALAEKLENTATNVDEITAQIAVFTKALNEGEGTLHKLMHDDELYQRLSRTVENVEVLTMRLRPIMEDVRIFTDKIARDPRQIGVAGVLDRRPSRTGLKFPLFNRDGGTVGESTGETIVGGEVFIPNEYGGGTIVESYTPEGSTYIQTSPQSNGFGT